MKYSLENNFVIYSNQRPDRDNYVKFNPNVIPFDPNRGKMFKDFRTVKSKLVDTQNLPYDATSILHYTSTQGSVDCNPTCIPTFTSNVSTQI